MPLKIVFMGTPEFSLPSLKALIENKFNILCVYTQSPKKSQRGQKINVSPTAVSYTHLRAHETREDRGGRGGGG